MMLHLNSPLYTKLCNPTNAPLPSSTLSSGTGTAQYDSTFTAPFCQGSSSSCDSDSLLNGRVGESNSPNTIDGCSDGGDTTVTYTEAVNRIVVSSVDGSDLRGGNLVKIEATVNAYSKKDRVDFYFAANATSPNWKFITAALPLAGESIITLPYTNFTGITYTLPKCSSESGCKQAIR
jgi:leucyl aminopeptidase